MFIANICVCWVSGRLQTHKQELFQDADDEQSSWSQT